jgi:hypothetical protein
MKQLPRTTNPLVIRTEFGNRPAWESICQAVRAPVHEGEYTFKAYLDFLDDAEFRNLTVEELITRVPPEYKHSILFVVDEIAIAHPESAILFVDLTENRDRYFRAIPSQIQGIENNLSISNMNFDELAKSVGADGIFRGFQRPG